MKSKVAVFPGSFDPFTVGHDSIVKRSLSLFDRIIVAIGENTSKKGCYTIDQRKEMISDIYVNEPRVSVESYSGLTIDFCKQKGATSILRGLRGTKDMEYEQAIAQMNLSLNDSIETVFLMSLPEHVAISSTILRDILRNGGDISAYVPTALKLPK